MTRRRLLLVTDALSEGGDARHLRAILGRISRSRFDVGLVSLFDGPPPPDDIERSRVDSRHLQLDRDETAEGIAERLRPVVEERGVDLIHAHSPIAGAAAVRVAEDRPVVLTVYRLSGDADRDDGGPGAVLPETEGRSLRRHVATTDAIRRRLESEAGLRGVRTIPPFVDLARFIRDYDGVDRASARRRWGLQRGEVALLHVGEIRRESRVLDLLEAFRVALRELPSLRLFIVGEGPALPDARARAEELDVGDSVVFASRPADPFALLRMADLFVQPGTGEGFPLPLLDALTAGLPAVVGGEGEDLGAVEAGAALRYQEGRVEHMARQLLHLATDPQARKRMGAAAVERASSYDVGRWISRLEGLYAEL